MTEAIDHSHGQGSARAPRAPKQEQLTAEESVTEVAPGILRMQLPINLPGLGHVNCYVLEDELGLTVVDPGLPNPESFEVFESRLAQLGAKPDHVHTVVVTHSHPDHFGGAGRLRIRYDARVIAHEHFRTIFDPADDDSELIPATSSTVERWNPDKIAETMLGDGPIGELPERRTIWGGVIPLPSILEINHMRTWDADTKRGFLTPSPTLRIADGDPIRLGRRDWFAVHTPGHTEDHLCLWDPEEGVLLSGDHVLPTITPHISGLGTTQDSLADFFGALDKVAALPGVRHVLPAHGLTFTDLPKRVDEIQLHHRERLDRLAEISSELGEADVIEMSHHLFRERSWGAMAESETFAHLEHLRLAGRAVRREAEGRLWYRIAG